jgi:hypothetical protein
VRQFANALRLSGFKIAAGSWETARPSGRRVRIATLPQPLDNLRRRYHTFWQMRIERASSDILAFGQFLFRKFLRLELATKCFGRSRERSFPWSQLFGLK